MLSALASRLHREERLGDPSPDMWATIEVCAKAANPGEFKQHWLGGFERRHGFPTEEIIGFWIYQGTYKVVTYWDGAGKETALSSQDNLIIGPESEGVKGIQLLRVFWRTLREEFETEGDEGLKMF